MLFSPRMDARNVQVCVCSDDRNRDAFAQVAMGACKGHNLNVRRLIRENGTIAQDGFNICGRNCLTANVDNIF
ncbi:MAG: hypothetical protein ABJ327_06760, partial [Litoreibacter sp.]